MVEIDKKFSDCPGNSNRLSCPEPGTIPVDVLYSLVFVIGLTSDFAPRLRDQYSVTTLGKSNLFRMGGYDSGGRISKQAFLVGTFPRPRVYECFADLFSIRLVFS